MTKDEIRLQMKALRRDNPDAAEHSAAICRLISSLPEFSSARTVLSYAPMKGEVDVSLVEYGDRKVILTDCPWEDIPAGEIDFAIIPGVAFGPDGMRLGRGGGYYDRLLPKLHCPTAGVAFGFQILDSVPADEWDRPVDMVISPDGIRK